MRDSSVQCVLLDVSMSRAMVSSAVVGVVIVNSMAYILDDLD